MNDPSPHTLPGNNVEDTIKTVHLTDQKRFELWVANERVALLEYADETQGRAMLHTETAAEHGGRGYATRLVGEVLAVCDTEERRVLPFCPFVSAYIRNHREYVHLVPSELVPRFHLQGGR